MKYSNGSNENDRLKLALQQAEETTKTQGDDLTRLASEVLKANETIQLLSQDVQIEHEEGFNKALR